MLLTTIAATTTSCIPEAARRIRAPEGHGFGRVLGLTELAFAIVLGAPALATLVAVERHVAVMGTMLTIEVRAATREEALRISAVALSEIEAAEALLSTWRTDTPLARLNEAPPGVPIRVPLRLATAL